MYAALHLSATADRQFSFDDFVGGKGSWVEKFRVRRRELRRQGRKLC